MSLQNTSPDTKISSLHFLQFWRFPSNHNTFPGHKLVGRKNPRNCDRWHLRALFGAMTSMGMASPRNNGSLEGHNSAILIDAGGTSWRGRPLLMGSVKRILCCYALKKYWHQTLYHTVFLPKTPKQSTLGALTSGKGGIHSGWWIGQGYLAFHEMISGFSSGVQPSRQQQRQQQVSEIINSSVLFLSSTSFRISTRIFRIVSIKTC